MQAKTEQLALQAGHRAEAERNVEGLREALRQTVARAEEGQAASAAGYRAAVQSDEVLQPLDSNIKRSLCCVKQRPPPIRLNLSSHPRTPSKGPEQALLHGLRAELAEKHDTLARAVQRQQAENESLARQKDLLAELLNRKSQLEKLVEAVRL